MPIEPKLDYQAWARKQLNVNPDAGPAATRAAFLRLVASQNFLPSLSAHEAFEVLCKGSDAARPSAAAMVRADSEADLRAEVETFADRFFLFAPPERRERWAELLQRCEWVLPLAVRLQSLRVGLDTHVVPPADDPDAAELVERACELFVMRAPARAQRRREFLEEMAGEPSRWVAAARRLRGARSDIIAALAPEFLDSLLGQPLLDRKVVRQLKKKVPKNQNSIESSGSGWLVFLVVVLLAGAASRQCDTGKSRTPPQFQPLPKVKQ